MKLFSAITMFAPDHHYRKEPLIAVIDVGTKTIRFVVFSTSTKEEVVSYQTQIGFSSPQEGWEEQDPLEILSSVHTCITNAIEHLLELDIPVSNIVSVGIANQRETTLVWDSVTGKPLYNAIMWSDIRTTPTIECILKKLPDNNKDHFKPLCGLPVSPYISALKLCWLIDNISLVRKAAEEHRCFFGTVDTWLVWNLTGGKDGGLHITDVTNASRTMLMNIDSLKWDPILCKYFNIPMDILPEIKSSSEIYGKIIEPPLAGIPISGILGNLHSALVGQLCLHKHQAKNTYRNDCSLLYNTGTTKVHSQHGLITTVAYQLGPNSPPVYALEGSVTIAGAALNWLRDNLNLLENNAESESLAEVVVTAGDTYFVPAFSGLYAPYWRKDARGILCGLTQYTKRGHIIRAALEAICFQTRDIIEAMNKDCGGMPLTKLQVDGKLTGNRLLMQLQADLSGIPVVASSARDVVSLGAALVAGHAQGIDLWDLHQELEKTENIREIYLPCTSHEERNLKYSKWKMAVQRSLGWVTAKHQLPHYNRFRNTEKNLNV